MDVLALLMLSLFCLAAFGFTIILAAVVLSSIISREEENEEVEAQRLENTGEWWNEE